MFKIFGNWKTLDLEVLKIQRCEVNKLWSNFASYAASEFACVQTSPISFVARGTKEIGDVCTQATSE